MTEEPVVAYITHLARERLWATRILLFGSRARGDHRERSDYDFAFEFPVERASEWNRFVLDASENAPTLCGLDLVNLAEVKSELKQKILQEGRELK